MKYILTLSMVLLLLCATAQAQFHIIKQGNMVYAQKIYSPSELQKLDTLCIISDSIPESVTPLQVANAARKMGDTLQIKRKTKIEWIQQGAYERHFEEVTALSVLSGKVTLSTFAENKREGLSWVNLLALIIALICSAYLTYENLTLNSDFFWTILWSLALSTMVGAILFTIMTRNSAEYTQLALIMMIVGACGSSIVFKETVSPVALVPFVVLLWMGVVSIIAHSITPFLLCLLTCIAGGIIGFIYRRQTKRA